MTFPFRTRFGRFQASTLLLGAVLAVTGTAASQTQSGTAAPRMTVYKSPTCGCCSKWVDHMKANGFSVTALDVDDVDVPMRTYNVPSTLASCHTAVVGGYVVEGHVPADVVLRMLREKPQIAGVSAPGMPVGSPGMEMPGGKTDSYNIMSFDRAGRTAVYEKR
jgi:hypothetical protein